MVAFQLPGKTQKFKNTPYDPRWLIIPDNARWKCALSYGDDRHSHFTRSQSHGIGTDIHAIGCTNKNLIAGTKTLGDKTPGIFFSIPFPILPGKEEGFWCSARS